MEQEECITHGDCGGRQDSARAVSGKNRITVSSFKSEQTPVSASAEKVYSRLSNLDNLASLLARVPGESIPDDKREMFDNIKIDSDSITLPGGPVGEVCLAVTERREPTLIRLEGKGTPVPMAVMLHITPTGADSCETQAEIDIQIPMMLAPMVKGPLQKMVDQFAAVVRAIPFD